VFAAAAPTDAKRHGDPATAQTAVLVEPAAMTIHRRLLLPLTICGAVTFAPAVSSGTAAAATMPPRKELVRAINHVRAAYGLDHVRGAPALRRIALSHSEDMLRREYFAHTSPTGSTLAYRVQRSGFVRGYSWTAGETLAWGVGTQGSARATAVAWLKSSEHRAIMLSGAYHWVGIGRNCGHFLGHANACVWTADFVRRW
jgi:uncharacterized protein YkwD